VCLLNPWTWRLAVLPFETAWYLHRNDLSGGPSAHPWSSMGDLRRPTLFHEGLLTDGTGLAFLACVVVILAGAAAAVRRQRWDWLILAAGMTLVGFSAQRNMAVGMIAALPFALAALVKAAWWPAVHARCHPRLDHPAWRVTAPAALVLVSLTLAWAVITNGFYRSQDSPLRFGGGLSSLRLPVAATRWLGEHQVKGRIWASPLCSSTLSGFVEPRPSLNMVSNTWAYPPAVMQQVLTASSSYDAHPFGPTATRFEVSVVVTQGGRFLRSLATDPRWAPVHIEGQIVVLARRDGPDADLAARHAMSPVDLDTGKYIEHTRRLDPVAGQALWLSGRTLFNLQWYDQALEVLAASRIDNPDEPRAWLLTASVLTSRGALRAPTNQPAARRDLEEAREALAHAFALTGDTQITGNIQFVEGRLQLLDRLAAPVDRTAHGPQP
jgi:hypothetical protein